MACYYDAAALCPRRHSPRAIPRSDNDTSHIRRVSGRVRVPDQRTTGTEPFYAFGHQLVVDGGRESVDVGFSTGVGRHVWHTSHATEGAAIEDQRRLASLQYWKERGSQARWEAGVEVDHTINVLGILLFEARVARLKWPTADVVDKDFELSGYARDLLDDALQV